MVKEHNFSLSEIDNLIPWEKTVYVSLISKYLKDLNSKK
jgi:hypothetical protein